MDGRSRGKLGPYSQSERIGRGNTIYSGVLKIRVAMKKSQLGLGIGIYVRQATKNSDAIGKFKGEKSLC